MRGTFAGDEADPFENSLSDQEASMVKEYFLAVKHFKKKEHSINLKDAMSRASSISKFAGKKD